MIKGITVTLYETTQTGTDALNRPIYEETPMEVANVLVAPVSETEILDIVNMDGRKAVYTLGIPKGDAHDWIDKRVSFFGQDWHTIGKPIEGIEELIPLEWNKKVRCEAYGESAKAGAQYGRRKGSATGPRNAGVR